jgi:hypothetical protein
MSFHVTVYRDFQCKETRGHLKQNIHADMRGHLRSQIHQVIILLIYMETSSPLIIMSFYMESQKNVACIGILVVTLSKVSTGRLWVNPVLYSSLSP